MLLSLREKKQQQTNKKKTNKQTNKQSNKPITAKHTYSSNNI